MFRTAFTILVLLSVLLPEAFGQKPLEVRLPQDADRLVARSQEFWASMVAGQRSRAVQYVTEGGRDVFLRGSTTPLLGATLLGIDLTSRSDQASVRTRLTGLILGMAGPTSWIVSSKWIRERNNWYIEISEPDAAIRAMAGVGDDGVDTELLRKEIESGLRVPESFDAGVVLRGYVRFLQFPLSYSGKFPLTVDTAPRGVLYAADEAVKADGFRMAVGPNVPIGEVILPLTLKFSHGRVVFERATSVKVRFTDPFTFRQVPEGPIRAGDTVTVFIGNNTGEDVLIERIVSQFEGEMIERPQVLRKGQEERLVYRPLVAGEEERLVITLSKTTFGLLNLIHALQKTP